MKIVNRGFIVVRPKQPMIDWVNGFEDEFTLDANSEPTIYLIEDDFIDEDPILKANFKSIFMNELLAITEDETNFPEIKFEVFTDWFQIEIGTSTFDTMSNLQAH